MKSIFLLLLPAIVLCSCHTQKQEDESAHAVTLKGDIIHIGSESPVLSKLTKETVKREPYRMEFTTSGVVQAIPSNYAEVASPVSGRITKSFVRLGQKVAPGSPIFEISAPAVYEAGKSYYQARQEMELALKSLNREKDLMKNKVGVQKELEEAEVNYELKKKDYENMVAALKVFQINPDEMALGQPLIVRSPIAGEVVKDRIVIGQYMKEDAEPVAVIADLSKVWVVAHVKEKDLKNNLSYTLITKILMGTIGCVPAYDRYFIAGIKNQKVATGSYNIKSILQLADFYERNESRLEPVRENMTVYDLPYPQMKMIDMGFWQIGFDLDTNKEINVAH